MRIINLITLFTSHVKNENVSSVAPYHRVFESKMVARLERKAAREHLAADQIPPECTPPLFTSIKLIPPKINKTQTNSPK